MQMYCLHDVKLSFESPFHSYKPMFRFTQMKQMQNGTIIRNKKNNENKNNNNNNNDNNYDDKSKNNKMFFFILLRFEHRGLCDVAHVLGFIGLPHTTA